MFKKRYYVCKTMPTMSKEFIVYFTSYLIYLAPQCAYLPKIPAEAGLFPYEIVLQLILSCVISLNNIKKECLILNAKISE